MAISIDEMKTLLEVQSLVGILMRALLLTMADIVCKAISSR